MNLFISIRPDKQGGGSNTFAFNVTTWAKRNRYRLVARLEDADIAIVIAHCGVTEQELQRHIQSLKPAS